MALPARGQPSWRCHGAFTVGQACDVASDTSLRSLAVQLWGDTDDTGDPLHRVLPWLHLQHRVLPEALGTQPGARA
jgi:hypothetical protein